MIIIIIISYILRELALAYRRKYRMSCVHACVGSFGAITRVCQMGWGGRFVHLRPPPFTSLHLALESIVFAGGLVREVPPIFASSPIASELKK